VALPFYIKKGILMQKKKKKKNYGNSNIISPCKNYNLQKKRQKLGDKNQQMPQFWAFPLSKSISKCNKLWFKQTPQQLGSSFHNIPI
jgi:hypothetical protein